MNEKREPLRFASCLRICFKLLHPKTEMDATEVPLISPLIRIASFAVFPFPFMQRFSLYDGMYTTQATLNLGI